MEWLKSLTDVAALPLQVLLLAAVIILWMKVEALQKENKTLMERIITITGENLHVSADNHERIKRVEEDQLGKIYPTIQRRDVIPPT